MAHPAKVKRAALARLVVGESPGSVARGMALPYSTIKRWQSEALGKNGHQKKAAGASALGAGVGDYLGEALVSGRALVVTLRDPGRLRAMGARELAIAHGQLFDRAFRLLGGLR